MNFYQFSKNLVVRVYFIYFAFFSVLLIFTPHHSVLHTTVKVEEAKEEAIQLEEVVLLIDNRTCYGSFYLHFAPYNGHVFSSL